MKSVCSIAMLCASCFFSPFAYSNVLCLAVEAEGTVEEINDNYRGHYRCQENGEILGWAHLFEVDSGVADKPPSQLVFLPGFEIEPSDDGPIPGSLNSALSILENKVGTDDGGVIRPLMPIFVDEEDYSVWVIEYASSEASVQENSKLLSAFLKTSSDSARLVTPRMNYEADAARSYVMGFSMGGIIARYALVDMEHKNQNHYTSAYISLDAPHGGAFLHPSLEIMARTLPLMISGNLAQGKYRDLRDQVLPYLEKYNTDAAKQLLGIYTNKAQHSGLSGLVDMYSLFVTWLNNPEVMSDISFRDLRSELLMMGSFPQQNITNIGITNGILEGGYINLMPGEVKDGQNILHARSQIDTGGFTRYSINLNHPGYQTALSKLCYLHIFGKRRHCPDVALHPNYEHIFNVAGSTQDSFGPLATAFNEDTANTAFISDGEDGFTFIPAVSALAIPTNNFVIPVEQVAQNLSPFDYVIGNSFNSDLPNQGNFPHTVVSGFIRDQLIGILADLEINRGSEIVYGSEVDHSSGVATVSTDDAPIIIQNTDLFSPAVIQAIADMQEGISTDVNIVANPTVLNWQLSMIEAMNREPSLFSEFKYSAYGASVF